MAKNTRAGFTLIELLVVIGIIGLLAVFLLPNVLGARTTANIAADQANMRELYKLYFQMRDKGKMPKQGGCKFVLSPWFLGEVDKTESNFKRFFTPGLTTDDPHYKELAEQDFKTIWPNEASVTSQDTHYAGRSAKHFMGMNQAAEAWLANDNEFGMAFNNGTVNVLYADASVKGLDAVKDLAKYGFKVEDAKGFDVGPGSPHKDLAKLEK